MKQLRYSIVILLLTIIEVVNAAPTAQLIPFWNHSNQANNAKINHSAWQQILNRYLNTKHHSGINRFNYRSLKANNKYVTVVGKSLSLNNIEHNILRPIWRDNRIHYAVNCASLGCPNLAAKAYTSTNTEILLNNAAKDYINHKRGVQFNNGKLIISSIYKWYKVDFGNVKKHLIKYAKPRLAKQLRNYRGSFNYNYNWNLNAV